MMPLYSLLFVGAGLLGLPWWIARLRRSPDERDALTQRLGVVPRNLRADAAGFRNVWLHAVSVGEVLAASRLVPELTAALEAVAPGERPWRVLVSTTTVTGQKMARERFGRENTFYNPLDLAFAVRAFLGNLRPAALILMESELWPHLLHECERSAIPVAVANARVSDRSFHRTARVRWLWRRLLGSGVALWCAQTTADAQRLHGLGVEAAKLHVTGNLKYDVRAPKRSQIAEHLREAAAGRPIVVCGSTTGDRTGSEDELLLRETLPLVWEACPEALAVLAPRHPERFDEVFARAQELAGPALRATLWMSGAEAYSPDTRVLVLDTIGDLAAVYALATAAFVGGSLLPRGGHNPLEPAQFGIPIVTGPSEENFRDITGALRDADGLLTGADAAACGDLLAVLLTDEPERIEAGQAARRAFEQQGGATARTVDLLLPLILNSQPGGRR